VSWTLDGRPLRRILVTRLRFLGDVVMSTVVVEMLKRGDPTVEVDFLCEANHAVVLAGHPQLSAVHALGVTRRGHDAAVRAASGAANARPGRGTLATIIALRKRRHDLAVDLFFNPRSAWLLRLAGIPARIGGTASSSRRHLYTHHATSPSPAERPELYRLAGGGLGEHLSRLADLRLAGRPFLDWFEEEAATRRPAPRVPRPPASLDVMELLAGLEASTGATLLAPGATWPSKEWPLAHWRRLASDLAATGETVLVLQPPGRPDIADALGAAIPAGQGGVLPPLPLAAALEVLGTVGKVVSVDGGVMHAAVGMGVPTLALFGPTDPALWFPYAELGPFRVLATRPSCHPCHRHQCDQFICLPELTPTLVLDAASALPSGPIRLD
jgi:ADP-heptose:LPS heptosyltransferase